MTKIDESNIEDIFEKYADLDEEIYMNENPLELKVRGRSFSLVDRGHIKNIINKLVSKNILPFIERKIRVLETGVANTRKGFKN